MHERISIRLRQKTHTKTNMCVSSLSFFEIIKTCIIMNIESCTHNEWYATTFSSIILQDFWYWDVCYEGKRLVKLHLQCTCHTQCLHVHTHTHTSQLNMNIIYKYAMSIASTRICECKTKKKITTNSRKIQ